MIMLLLDRFVEFATAWMWLVLLATWRALPILVMVLGIGLVLRRRLSPSLQALLLTLVVVRLLLPVSVGSPLSVHKLIDNWFSNGSQEGAVRVNVATGPDRAYDLLPYTDHIDARGDWVQADAQPPVSFSGEEALWAAVLFTVVLVSGLLLLCDVVSHIRFAFKLRSCRLMEQPPLIDVMLRECDSLAVGRRPVVREVPTLAAPAVFGILQKTICFPANLIESLNEQELRWVIRHELAHIRRHDISVMIMASIVNAFHWFNPVVWIVIGRLRASMEAAADQLSLETLSQSEASTYGKLLLRLAENNVAEQKSTTLGLISFASGRHLKQRVERLMQARKSTGITGRYLIPGLVGAVACAGLTDAEEAKKKIPDINLVASHSIAPLIQSRPLDPFSGKDSDGPSFIEEYDLKSIFESMPRSLTESKTSRQEQLTSWLPLSPSLKGKLHVEGEILSANLTAPQHQHLKKTLDTWKQGEPKQVSIETRFIQTNVKIASSIDWAGRKVDGLIVQGLGPALAARIDESELAHLVRTVSAEERGNTLFAPKVTLFDGQTAGISDQVHRPFVTGIDPKADGQLQPVISVIDEGLRLELTPNANDDQSVSLAFEVIVRSIGKVSYANLPIKTSHDSQPQCTVQVPATEQYEISSSVVLAAGESVVVAIPRVFNIELGADADTTVIVALTPRIIDTQASGSRLH